MRAIAVSLVAVLLVASNARAQAPAETAGVAEALFRDGVSLFEAGKIREACAKFAESYRLDPANGTLQNEALCHEREGKVASAWAEFALLAGRAAQAGQKEREKMARAQVAELDKRLARVAFAFDRTTNVEQVIVDGEELGRAAWSTPVPLDPGEHAIAFRAAGHREVVRSIAMPQAAATIRVAVPTLEAIAPADAAREPATPSAPVVAPMDATRTEPDPTRRTIALVTGGVGAALVAGGAYFGLVTLSKKSDVSAHCAGPYCDATGLAADHDAHDAATLSTIGFAGGAALIGAAAILWITAPDVPVRVAPTVGGARVIASF